MRLLVKWALVILVTPIVAGLHFYLGFWLTGLSMKLGLDSEAPAFGLALLLFFFVLTFIISKIFADDSANKLNDLSD